MFGPIFFFWQATEFRTQNASLHWPIVTGTVIESSLSGHPGLKWGHYRAHIVYSYEINGAPYKSYQICLWSSNEGLWANDHDTKRFVDTHPVGSEVTVYYDPKQFGNAVLIPGADGQLNVLGMILGASMVVIAILSIVSGIQRRRVLKTLLNAPDARTRTIQMRKVDIENGRVGFLVNVVIALGFMAPAVGLLASCLLSGPAIFPRTNQATPLWLPIAAAVPCVLGFLFFITRAVRQSRSAECPLCRNTLNKTAVKNARCTNCGTRIIFENPAALQFSHPEKHKPAH